MALVKQTLADALEIAFSRENSAKDAAEAIATAIDNYVKAAVVSTTVVGTSPSGPVTGTGTGTLS